MKDDDYLFDPGSAPDDEVQRLEALLKANTSPARSRPVPPRRDDARAGRSRSRSRPRRAVVIAVSFSLDKKRPVATSPTGVPSEMSPAIPGPALVILEGKGATVGGAAPGAMLPSKAPGSRRAKRRYASR